MTNKRMSAQGGQAGIGIDKFGDQVIDPTENVMALVKAQAKHESDLRKSDNKLSDTKFKHIEFVAALRSKHVELLRKSDLEGLARTREVDVLAAASTAAGLATAVATLAQTTARDAETLRNTLVSTNASNQVALENIFKGFTAQIQELQKANFLSAGKSTVVDPQMAQMVEEIKKLATITQSNSGRREGVNMSWVVLLGVISMIATLLAIFGNLN